MGRTVAKATIDHDVIRIWAQERGGFPARDQTGELTINFPNVKGEGRLDAIGWDEFFREFEAENLAMLYQDKTDGHTSRFHQFVPRDMADVEQKERLQNAGSTFSSGAYSSTRASATDVLRRDHREVEKLFDELERADDGVRSASEIFAQLRMSLEVHTQLEEEVFYPAVRDSTASSRFLIDQAKLDHEHVESLLGDLAELDEDSDEYQLILRELKQSVRAHVAVEEEQIFAEAERGLDSIDLERLALDMEALRDDLISRAPDERGLGYGVGAH